MFEERSFASAYLLTWITWVGRSEGGGRLLRSGSLVRALRGGKASYMIIQWVSLETCVPAVGRDNDWKGGGSPRREELGTRPAKAASQDRDLPLSPTVQCCNSRFQPLLPWTR